MSRRRAGILTMPGLGSEQMPAPAVLTPAAIADEVKRAPPRRVVVFIVLAFALMMMSIDASIVATALDALQKDLGAPLNWTGWTITAYWFGYVVMLPVAGRLAERYGHRRVFLGSTAAFALASLACGLSTSVYALVIFRALEAMGGAGLTPAATGIVVAWFGSARDRALGLFGAVFAVGAMIGPIFGGLFVTYASWRDVFFVNVPIGVVMAALGIAFIPRDRAADRLRQALDWVGMTWLGVALVAGMLAVSFLGNQGASVADWPFWLPMAIAVGCAWSFLHHIRHAAEPFLTPRLIYGRGFAATNFLNAVYGGLASGAVTLVPLYAATRYGLSALDAGTLLITEGIAAIVFAGLAAWGLRRTGYHLPFYVGASFIAIGLLWLAPAPRFGLSPYVWLAIAAAFVGAGGGVMGPASRNACLELVPERASTMAALRATAQELGVIVALAVTTAIMARAPDGASALAVIYACSALLCVLVLPVVHRIPEHRGAW